MQRYSITARSLGAQILATLWRGQCRQLHWKVSLSPRVILNRHFELIHPGPGCNFEIAVNSHFSFVESVRDFPRIRFSTQIWDPRCNVLKHRFSIASGEARVPFGSSLPPWSAVIVPALCVHQVANALRLRRRPSTLRSGRPIEAYPFASMGSVESHQPCS